MLCLIPPYRWSLFFEEEEEEEEEEGQGLEGQGQEGEGQGQGQVRKGEGQVASKRIAYLFGVANPRRRQIFFAWSPY